MKSTLAIAVFITCICPTLCDESPIDALITGEQESGDEFSMNVSRFKIYVIENKDIKYFRKFISDEYEKYFKQNISKHYALHYDVRKDSLIFDAIKMDDPAFNKVLVDYFFGSLEKYKKLTQKEVIFNIISKLSGSNRLIEK